MNFKEELKGKEYKHRYLYDENKKRVGVLVTVDGKSAFAFCNPKDHFDKAKGRYIAYQRALKGKVVHMPHWLDAQYIEAQFPKDLAV